MIHFFTSRVVKVAIYKLFVNFFLILPLKSKYKVGKKCTNISDLFKRGNSDTQGVKIAKKVWALMKGSERSDR